MRQMMRQGDVLLVPVERQTVDETKAEKKDGDKAVLALGEATGHHHRINHPGATLYAVSENLRILRLEEAATLEHEEHAPIQLPSGDYQVIQQRESTALGWRTAVD